MGGEKSEKKQKEAAEEERGQAERRPAGSEGQNENQKTKMPKKSIASCASSNGVMRSRRVWR
jgi:hypothetical protein